MTGTVNKICDDIVCAKRKGWSEVPVYRSFRCDDCKRWFLPGLFYRHKSGVSSRSSEWLEICVGCFDLRHNVGGLCP